MDVYLIVVRLIHIGAAFFWVGSAALMGRFVLPAAHNAGDDGRKFMRSFLTSTRFPIAIAASAGIAVLAGILLWLRGSSGHFSSLGWTVLTIGAVVGIITAINGGAVTSRRSREYGAALSKSDSTPEQLAALEAKLLQGANIDAALGGIALLCMALARYL